MFAFHTPFESLFVCIETYVHCTYYEHVVALTIVNFPLLDKCIRIFVSFCTYDSEISVLRIAHSIPIIPVLALRRLWRLLLGLPAAGWPITSVLIIICKGCMPRGSG